MRFVCGDRAEDQAGERGRALVSSPLLRAPSPATTNVGRIVGKVGQLWARGATGLVDGGSPCVWASRRDDLRGRIFPAGRGEGGAAFESYEGRAARYGRRGGRRAPSTTDVEIGAVVWADRGTYCRWFWGATCARRVAGTRTTM